MITAYELAVIRVLRDSKIPGFGFVKSCEVFADVRINGGDEPNSLGLTENFRLSEDFEFWS
jgi:hypothetical protein